MRVVNKRFNAKYKPIADAVARMDIDQLLREELAEKLCEAFAEQRHSPFAWLKREAQDFKPDLFRLLASDPLCLCAGVDDEPCPDKWELRIGMHLSSASDGRSAAWAPRKPVVRCVFCGSRQRERMIRLGSSHA